MYSKFNIPRSGLIYWINPTYSSPPKRQGIVFLLLKKLASYTHSENEKNDKFDLFLGSIFF